jgi:hypothetical protein
MHGTILLNIKSYDRLLWIHFVELEDLAAYPDAYSDIFWQVSVMIATKIETTLCRYLYSKCVIIHSYLSYKLYITVIDYLLYSMPLRCMQESQGIFITN